MRALTVCAAIGVALVIPATASAMPLPAPVPAPPGVTITASVDCTEFDIDLTGLQPNTRVMVEMGSEPTYGFDYQGEHPNTWQFTVTDDGHASARLPIGIAEQGTEFMTAIGLIDIATGAAAWPFYQWVDCTQPPVIADAVVAVADPPVPDVVQATIALFADVAEAPPW